MMKKTKEWKESWKWLRGECKGTRGRRGKENMGEEKGIEGERERSRYALDVCE